MLVKKNLVWNVQVTNAKLDAPAKAKPNTKNHIIVSRILILITYVEMLSSSS